MSNKDTPIPLDGINRLPQNERRVLYTGRNEPGQLPIDGQPANPAMDRRQSDKILLAHVRATFASFDTTAKRNYIHSLIHKQDQLTMADIETMLGLTSNELAKLQRDME